MTRAVLYSRTSGLDRERISHEAQIELCREYAGQRHYIVVAELSEDETGISGADFDAPVLNRILDMARGDQFDVLICREIDRLARSLAKQLVFESEFDTCGVRVEYALDTFDDTPEGQLQKNIRAVIAEYERHQIRRRLQRGRHLAVQRGEIMTWHRPPLGYVGTQDNGKNTLIIEPDEAEIVRRIFNWYAYGTEDKARPALRDIARWLQGVLTSADRGKIGTTKKSPRGRWAATSVREILINRAYIGQWQMNMNDGRTYIVAIEPIVDEATWHICQQRIKENKRLAPRGQKHPYLMRSRLVCGRCNYTLQHKVDKRNGRIIQRYRCSGVAHSDLPRKCNARTLRVDQLDPLVWRTVVELLTDQNAIDAAYADYRQSWEVGHTPLLERLDAIEDKLDAAETRRLRLLDLYLDGHGNKEIYVVRQAELDADIENLETERGRLLAQIETLRPERVETQLEFMAGVGTELQYIEAGDHDAQRHIIEMLDIRGVTDGAYNVTLYAGEFKLGTITVPYLRWVKRRDSVQ